MSLLRFTALLLSLLAVSAQVRSGDPAHPRLAITHVTVIDTAGGPAQADMTVVVEGERIAAVGSAATTPVPAGARVVDGAGRFLIPGLWDMHIHTFFGDWVPGGREVTLPLLLANGVTGARDMGSDLEPILKAREDVARGRLVGPRMVVSGPMLDGPKSQFPSSIAIATPGEGRRAVAMLKRRGVDFIKIQSFVPRDAYFAIAGECRDRRIACAGHVPDAVRAAAASSVGQKSFEHLIGVFEGSSWAEEELLKGPKGPARFLDTYSAAQEASLTGLLARNGTWQCPTLFWERGQWLVDTVDVAKNPDAKYAPASWREKTWPTFTKGILETLATDPLAVRQKFVAHELAIVERLHRAGVPFLAGTDTPAGVDVVPGFSLHQELQRFVDAGFTPMEALQTATINPPRFLGRLADLGTVEKGKLADLVLLDGNPLDDIRNTRKIQAVVASGRYYSRERLDSILADIEGYARGH